MAFALDNGNVPWSVLWNRSFPALATTKSARSQKPPAKEPPAKERTRQIDPNKSEHDDSLLHPSASLGGLDWWFDA